MRRDPPAASAAPAGIFAARPASRWRWLLVVGGIVALLMAAKYFHVQTLLKQALVRVGQLGPCGAVIFIGLYIVSAVLLIPGSVLTLGAGAVFGLLKGIAIVSLASTSAATVAFLIGRYLARDVVARKIEGHAKFAAMDRAVTAEGWKIVLLTRLSPVFPFTLLNYAFGLTRVKLSHYMLASWIGMLPGTAMYVYLGTFVGAAVESRERTFGEWALYGAGLAATIAVTVMITRMARQALSEKAKIEP